MARSESLDLSSMHGESGDAETPTWRLLTQCGGTQCTVTEPLSGDVDTIDLANTPLRQGAPTAIGEKHGITLVWETSNHTGADLASLGAWLDDSSFAILNEGQTGDEGTVEVWYGIARGERLVGDAALTWDIPAGGDGSGASLDVAFGDIKNIDRGTAHTVETVRFENVAVGPDGTFGTGQSGTCIQGGFYGPGHTEATGIFEQFDIVGTFGATRQ